VARRKKHAEHENHERWLVSYADFITLLFAFFVVMFASSQGDKAKAKQVSDSVTKALEQGGFTALVHSVLGGTVDNYGQGNAQKKGPGGAQKAGQNVEPTPGFGEGEGGGPKELKAAMEILVRELADELVTGKMQIKMEARGLVVSFREAAFFRSGEAEISQENMRAADKVAGVLKQLANPVRMEGHTDAIPIHNAHFQSNWELSAARSIAMLELFSGRYQIPKEKMAIAAYADNAPAAPNDTEEGRARNRRVDIVLLSDFGKKSEPQTKQSAPVGAPPKNKDEAAPSRGGHH
jgi:chemotaxis protein MotB